MKGREGEKGAFGKQTNLLIPRAKSMFSRAKSRQSEIILSARYYSAGYANAYT